MTRIESPCNSILPAAVVIIVKEIGSGLFDMALLMGSVLFAEHDRIPRFKPSQQNSVVSIVTQQINELTGFVFPYPLRLFGQIFTIDDDWGFFG